MNKRLFLILVALLAFIFCLYAETQPDNGVQEVLREIRTAQDIEENNDIDVEEVSDQNLEDLGEALASVMYPDHQEQKYTNMMMGGDNSVKIKSWHKSLGYRYLTGRCCTDANPMGFAGGMMMGRGMMDYRAENFPGRGDRKSGPGTRMPGRRFNHMFHGFGPFRSYGIWSLIFWFVIIGLVVLVVYMLFRVSKDKNDTGVNSPVDLLKKRYARGEISKEEFEEKKKDIT